MVEIDGVVVCTNRVVKLKSTYHFVENSAHFVFKIELLLTVLSNFEKKAALEDSTF